MSKTPLPDYSQLARWTVNDVCTWLMENKFGNFVSQFREHGIDGGRFASLKDVDLSQMRCPLNKRTELIKCIRNIPNRDVSAPTLHKPVSTFTPSRPNFPSRIENRQPQPPPPSNEAESESDDDYEAWDEFENFDDDSGSDADYENEDEQQSLKKPNSRIPVEPSEPQEDYANYSPDHSDEDSSRNGHSITDSLRHALEQRNKVNQSHQRQEKPPEPEEPPPRPARPGRGVDRPPPQIPQPPRPGGRNRREQAPPPEPEEQPAYIETDDPLLNQPDYEVPEEMSSPAPKLPPSRPPMKPPVPEIDDQPTYEDPDETDNPPAPPPGRGGRRPPPKPVQPQPPEPDLPEDVYEDPDDKPDIAPAPIPQRTKQFRMPPVPNTQKNSPNLARTISEPDGPAPPPPRGGHGKHVKRMPPPVPTETHNSDDSNSNWRPTKKDYEKPETSLPKANKTRNAPRHQAKPPEDDYMAMADKAQESDDEEDYEKPDPAEMPPVERLPPAPRETKGGLKVKKVPVFPPQTTESGKKLPAGAVPVIGYRPDLADESTPPPVPTSHARHRGSQDENTPPPVPTSKTPHKSTPINEGRSLPPTPKDHRGTNGVPSSTNKPKGRGSVIDRKPPPIPGEENDITQCDWYQNVNRAEADEVLKNFGKNGTFLIRPSTKAGQPYTLQIYNDRKVYNLPIRQRADSTFALGREKRAEETFITVVDLVDFFRKHTLILAAGGTGQTRLKHSCPRI
ncbi:basic salivary proline-rich protein 2-like isoform X6 [Saccostrea cucullata]|uniref:basic salivary proline-rich protein 2-like isoform X6 n=1 Tax=Saccostrea cuccullata TaxID=36930 RepID=UPI002ED48454